jgi:AcrR family transcriptional regulator
MVRRAKGEEETRRRITKSTVALHEQLGPARTSVKAIAEHAGVPRSTVYRHFPDERSLFIACTEHWMAANPPPDPASFASNDDPVRRLHEVLSNLYPYYRRTRPMMESIHRDAEVMPLVKEMMGGYRGYLASMRDLLMQGRQPEPAAAKTVEAAIGHALSFPAWRSLAIEQGLSDEECRRLMCCLADSVSG